MKLPKISLFLTALIIIVIFAQHFVINQQIKDSIDQTISQSTQEANITVTKLFINELYPKISSMLKLKEEPNRQRGLEGEELDIVDKRIKGFMLGTDILKIKIYSLNGITLYSSEKSQIHQDKSFSQLIKNASQGKVASQITHRGKFSALEGEVFDKDLVSSYLPIRDNLGSVLGVAEIYTDRTISIGQSSQKLSIINAFMFLFEVIIAILIFFIIWNMLIHTNKNEEEL